MTSTSSRSEVEEARAGVDGTQLVGMVSRADIARPLPDAKVGDLVGATSAAPSNS
jgi:hypothetical protein